MNTYQKTLEFLFSRLPMYQRVGQAAYKANLDTTVALDTYFKHPHKKFKTIHVAGTNGKGSVSHMLAAIFQKAGFKVGLYTSPHLIDFRERIKINGIPIEKDDVVAFVENHKAIIEKLKPSFFEMTVAMAFDYFAVHNVDIAIVEVGMGGRLDSTNIITPVLSIITNIGLDHTMFLGNDVEQIAREKAGIIKEEIPVVIGESDPITSRVFNYVANTKNSPLTFADQYLSIDYAMQSSQGKLIVNVKRDNAFLFENLQVDLLGAYQIKNVKTVLTAICKLNLLGFNISNRHIYEGLENCSQLTGLKGRWQILGNNPLVICDTGHNESGIKIIVDQLNKTPAKQLHMVFGVVNDKNINIILNLLPKNALYYFTKSSIPRALDADFLKEYAAKYDLIGNAFIDVKSAFEAAISNAAKEDVVFVGGSTFVVADLLELIELNLVTI